MRKYFGCQIVTINFHGKQQQKKENVIKGDTKGKSPLCKKPPYLCVFVFPTTTATFNKLWGFFGCLPYIKFYL